MVCKEHVWLCACACTKHTSIRRVLSSVFKLGLSCVISKCLTICRRSLPPQRDSDSMAVANSQPCVCTMSEICHGLCLYLGTALCVILLTCVGHCLEWVCSFCVGVSQPKSTKIYFVKSVTIIICSALFLASFLYLKIIYITDLWVPIFCGSAKIVWHLHKLNGRMYY